jgi:DNA-binding winged helix-turn-helix (wHTH) protein/TolB-like protein/tetratricopeptide (TPR) repeat protein
MDKQLPRYYEFGPFRLNVTEHLLQKSDGVVPLTPKLVDTLAVLVENSGHVVTKDGLMQTLWPDSFVEESSLTQNISLLRKALAEHGNGQQYIETIPKRGYRFVAEVRELNEQNGGLLVQERTHTEVLIEEHLIHDSKEPVRAANQFTVVQPTVTRDYHRVRKIALAGCAVLLLAAAFFLFQRDRTAKSAFAPKSIAVLPFKTMNPTTQNDLMGLGIADALILKLSRLDQSSVLPISSVFRYVNRDKDALSIGKELGVDTVLEGSVQQEGDRVRVTAQLISVSDGRTLWAGKFDDSYTSLFTLQDSISELMVTSLGSEIGTINKRPAAPLTKDPEAYQAYLTGFYFWNRRTKTNLSKAIDYLESAVNKDPNFAFAHAILADCYYLGSQDGYEILSSDESLRRANAAATRALALDETIAEAHATRAGILFEDGNYDQAEREFRRALELKPNYAVAHLRYGYFLFGDGKLSEALAQMKQAQQLDPVSTVNNVALAYVYTMMRDYDSAIKWNRKALELQPDFSGGRFNLAMTYLHKQMFAEALAEFETFKETDPPMALRGQAMVYGLSGRSKEARQLLKETMRGNPADQMRSLDMAILFGYVGEKETAFQWLEKVTPTRFTVARLRFDPELDPLRKDSRFQEYLDRHGIKAESD